MPPLPIFLPAFLYVHVSDFFHSRAAALRNNNYEINQYTAFSPSNSVFHHHGTIETGLTHVSPNRNSLFPSKKRQMFGEENYMIMAYISLLLRALK